MFKVVCEKSTDFSVNEIFMLILSCLCVSFSWGGFWLLIPGLNGTIAFFIAIMIIFLSFCDGKARENFIKNTFGWGSISFSFLAFLFMVIRGQKFVESFFLNSIYFLSIVWIASYFKDRPRTRKILSLYIWIEILLKFFSDIMAAFTDDYIIRNSALNSINEIGINRIISMTSLYSVVVVYFIILYNYKSIRYKLLSLIYILSTLVLLYFAQMTLILMITLFVTLLLIIINVSDIKKTIVFSLLVVLIVLIFLPNILKYLIENEIFGVETTNRLKDTYSLFFSGKSFSNVINSYDKYYNWYSSTEGRLYFYIQSVKAMLNNFFFGSMTPDYITPGNHSTWIDYIGNYGISIFIFYSSIIQYIKKLYSMGSLLEKKIILSFTILYLVAGILNAFDIVHFAIHIYLIIPYLYNDVFKPKSTI